MSENQQGMRVSMGGVLAVVALIAVFVALFFVAKGIFIILEWLAPVLIIGALIINYKTVLNFGKYLYGLLINRTLIGILAVILMIIGFPIVAGFLFGKSIIDRQVAGLLKEHEAENQFVEYEEIIELEDTRTKLLDERERE